MFKKPKNLAGRLLIRFAFIAFILILMAYWPTNIYDFPKTTPFKGGKLFNPYHSAGGNAWKLGNFHAHCNAWYGLSNGSGSNEDMYDAYLNRLNYDLLGISNYQTIDANADGKHKIHAYEHGYSPFKYHHVVVGAKSPSWKEYPLWQSIHQKQNVLKSIRQKDTSALIAIAHPKRGQAHSLEDIARLTDYDCIEAFNHLSTSISHWDAALSAGNPVYLLSDDDTHDHNHIFHTGRLATAVYLPTDNWSEKDVVRSIKSGAAYAVEIYTGEDETFEIHRKRIDNLPYLKQLQVKNDSIKVEFSEECEYVIFVGQDGRDVGRSDNVKKAWYIFKPEDTYVRIHAKMLHSHHDFFLNPVFRYTGEHPVKRHASVNWPYTIFYRITLGLIILLAIVIYWKWERGKRSLNRAR